MAKMYIPATTANLGPGFDSFGLAFDLFNVFEIEEIENSVEFINVDSRFANENNLVLTTYKQFLKKFNIPFKGLKIKIESNIPICRGLGSSSTLIVAGLVAANEIHKTKLNKNELLQLATEIEGHPDNVSPAIFGGLTTSIMDNNKVYTIPCKISDKIKFCCLVPEFELSTEKARKILPQTIPYKDAIFNLSHASFLLKALELGEVELIRISLQDKLHQPYRKQLIDEYNEVEKIAFDNGAISFCISGAGSTLLSLYTEKDFIEKIEKPIKQLKNNWKILQVNINNVGYKVLKK